MIFSLEIIMIGLLLQPVVQTITTVMTTVQFTSQTATHQ